METHPLTKLEEVCSHKMLLKVWRLTTIALTLSAVSCELVKVQTPVGNILGKEEKLKVNGTINAVVQIFRGIPYAEPPVGNRRFRRPHPKENFHTAFDATKHGPVCFYEQQEGKPIGSKFNVSEDCLRLNIYAPVSKKKELKPVMIWIHGGGFTHGDGNSFDGSLLAAFGDVIAVTVNYRLSYFGFFTTGDANAPGNYGLWDQHMAIKWVHNNIKAFGGNPEQVTLFGGSVGASSVVFHAFYPGNKRLFQRIIAQSGTITSPWAITEKSYVIEGSKYFAESAGCESEEPSKYMACLQRLEAEKLNKTINEDYEGEISPVVDFQYILDEPTNLLSGKTKVKKALEMFRSVDLLIGYNNADGLIDLESWLMITETEDIKNFTMPMAIFAYEFVPEYIKLYLRHENFTNMARMITVYEYTNWADKDNNIMTLLKLIELSTDTIAALDASRTALTHAKQNSLNRTSYAYEFAVPSDDTMSKVKDILPHQELAHHGDELPYIFGTDIKKFKADPALKSQLKTSLGMMTAWTNFAKTGNPNLPEDIKKYFSTSWPVFKPHMGYLKITAKMDAKSARTGMKRKALEFWENKLPSVISYSEDEYYDIP